MIGVEGVEGVEEDVGEAGVEKDGEAGVEVEEGERGVDGVLGLATLGSSSGATAEVETAVRSTKASFSFSPSPELLRPWTVLPRLGVFA